jgi:hypothetical protein
VATALFLLWRHNKELTFFLFFRTDSAFQQWLKKGVTFISTDYIIPSEMCAMVNVILDAKNQSFKLCAVDGVDVVT